MPDILEEFAQRIKELANRITRTESRESINFIIKTTTGTPAGGRTGNVCINTFDNKAYLYADGDWRQIASW